MVMSTLDVKTGSVSGFAGGQENAQVPASCESALRRCSDGVDHVMLVLDLSFSMAAQLVPLRGALRRSSVDLNQIMTK